MIRTKTTHTGKFYLLIVNLFLFVLIAVSMSSCSGGGGGSSSSGSSGTGGIAFSLNWQGSTASNVRASVIDCAANNIATITANVYSSSNNLLASGTWPCTAHSGTMNNIQAGSNYYVIVEAQDSSQAIIWAGQVINVTVNPGEVTIVTVTMHNSSDLLSIAINPLTPSIILGSSQQFTAMGTYSDSTTLDLTNVASWTSSNTGVATINAGGLATSVAVGSSNITATFASISNNAMLTVNPSTTGYSVSGQVTLNGAGLPGVTIAISGIGSMTTDSSGDYLFSGVANNSYTITPSKTGYDFTPSVISIIISNANATGQNFVADGIWDSSKWDNAPWGP